MQLTITIAACTLWLIAGVISGVTSFGGNLVAVPLLTFIWTPQKSIFIGCIVGGASSLFLAACYHKNIIWKEIFPLCSGIIPGIPLGVYILTYSGPGTLLFGVGISLTIFLIWQIFGNRIFPSRKQLSKRWAVPCGVICGILQGATGMGGPPLVVYAFLRKWAKECTIANINCSVAFALICWAITQIFNEINIDNVLFDSLTGTISVGCGVLVSIPIVQHINILLFKKLLIMMIGLAAFISYIRCIF